MARDHFDSSLFIRSPALRFPYRAVQPLVERAIGWRRVREVYEIASDAAKGGGSAAFVRAALAEFGVAWTISDDDRAALTDVDGPLVIAANHPFGGIDALSLLELVGELWGEDWSCFSNQFMAGIPEFAEHCLLVDPRGAATENRRAMATALARLRKGGVLCIFPAARVSPRSEELGAVCDMPWTDHVVRLAAKAGARLAVVHIAGHNSERFLKIPPKQLLRRTFALVRELGSPPVDTVEMSLSAVLERGGTRPAKPERQSGRAIASLLLRRRGAAGS